MSTESNVPEGFIRRPDGSYVELTKLEPRHQIAHELVLALFPKAVSASETLAELKKLALTEMRAYRDIMFSDYDLKVDGKEGGFSIKTACGTKKMELSISKHVSFGPELLAAKELLDQFLNEELEGSSDVVRDIVTDAFKLNAKGRLSTEGILGLRKHNWDSPLARRAMEAIDDAICRDSSTTYIRFYNIDPERKVETLVPLDLAKV